MRASRIVLGLASTTAALASSNDTTDACTGACKRSINGRTQFDVCMRQEDAQQVVDNYQNLNAEYTATLANASFTADLKWYPDSATTLIDSGCRDPVPLGTAVFDSLEALVAGQSSQPTIPFYIYNLWFTCNEIIIRWVSNGTPE